MNEGAAIEVHDLLADLSGKGFQREIALER